MRPLTLLLFGLCFSSAGCYLFHERSGASGTADAGRDGGSDVGASDGARPDGDPPPPPPPPRCALAPVAERFIASHPDGSMHAPDLFLAGDRIGVLMFQSDTISHPVVVLSHTDLALEEVVAPRRVGEESHGWGEAAWTGESVGVCWHGDPGGAGALRFRQIDGLDGALGRRTDFETRDGPCLDLVFAHGVYAMTWRVRYFDEMPARVETTFALMAESGELLTEPVALASADYPGHSPSLVATDDGFVVLVHVDEGLRVLQTTADGAVTSDRTLALDALGYTAAAMRDDRLGLLSLEGPEDTRGLVFRILTLDGRFVRERRIEGGTPTGTYPRVAARPEGWALVWGEGYRPSTRAMILSLDPDGVPLAPRRVLFDAEHSDYGGPSLLSLEERLYVGISHEGAEPPRGREGTYVQRWECSAPAEDLCREEHAQPGDCDGDHVWGFRWTGDRCSPVVGCESDCIGDDCDTLARTQIACESDRRECPAVDCPTTVASLARLCAPSEVASGRSHRLDVAIWSDDCPCTPRPRCRVEATGERELTLSFEQCADPVPDCACDPEPVPRPVTCVLPPLSPGEWTLTSAGAPPLTLLATNPWETPAAGALCAVE